MEQENCNNIRILMVHDDRGNLCCGQNSQSAMRANERRERNDFGMITLYCAYGNHDFTIKENNGYDVTRKYHICDKCKMERQRY